MIHCKGVWTPRYTSRFCTVTNWSVFFTHDVRIETLGLSFKYGLKGSLTMFAWLDAFKLRRQVPPCPYGCLPDIPLKEVPFPTSLIKNVDMSFICNPFGPGEGISPRVSSAPSVSLVVSSCTVGLGRWLMIGWLRVLSNSSTTHHKSCRGLYGPVPFLLSWRPEWKC